MGKGVSILVSHAAFMAIGVVALIIVSSMIWAVYDSVVKSEIKKGLTEVTQSVAGEIVKLYYLKDSNARPAENTSLLLGESSISLQQKVGGRQYMVELMQSSQITISNITEGNGTRYATQITAAATDPWIQVNYTLYNIDSKVQGFGYGDRPLVLKYYRLNYNGTVEDRIVLNDALIIAGESIS